MDNHVDRIIEFLSSESQRDEVLIRDIRALMEYCAASCEYDFGWSDSPNLNPLRSLSNGYGCWLTELHDAIAKADIPERDRLQLLAALGATAGLLQVLFIQPPRAE